MPSISAISALLVFALLFAGCETDPDSALIPDETRLDGYVMARQNNYTTSNQLIACAAGGRKFAGDATPDRPLSIFFLPVEGATDFKYWETDSIGPRDSLALYHERPLERLPVFGGKLSRFLRKEPQKEFWCRVSYLSEDSVHVSNAIRIKLPETPTRIENQAVVIDLDDPVRPKFDWSADPVPNTVIYFQVVSDHFGNLISGTYTFEQNFEFLNPSNVVININDIYTNPFLTRGATYDFTLMGVSIDNWVNVIASRRFVAE